jgi:hypothetical protein
VCCPVPPLYPWGSTGSLSCHVGGGLGAGASIPGLGCKGRFQILPSAAPERQGHVAPWCRCEALVIYVPSPASC